jgi:hypothetical protein
MPFLEKNRIKTQGLMIELKKKQISFRFLYPGALPGYRKLFAHFFNRLREWWRQRRNMNDQRETEREEVDQRQIQLELEQEYADNLEESLAQVYLRLVQANANNRWNRFKIEPMSPLMFLVFV